MYKHHKGFTLIELVITILIISILTVIAISLYTSQVRKGRRLDATNTLSEISLAQERYRSTNSQYGTINQVWGGVTTTTGGYYTLTISNVGSTAYTIAAQAVGDQANDSVDGTSCSTIQVSLSNGTITKSPSTCWPQ
jgi:type IV pilus assembly protein PilE